MLPVPTTAASSSCSAPFKQVPFPLWELALPPLPKWQLEPHEAPYPEGCLSPSRTPHGLTGAASILAAAWPSPHSPPCPHTHSLSRSYAPTWWPCHGPCPPAAPWCDTHRGSGPGGTTIWKVLGHQGGQSPTSGPHYAPTYPLLVGTRQTTTINVRGAMNHRRAEPAGGLGHHSAQEAAGRERG